MRTKPDNYLLRLAAEIDDGLDSLFFAVRFPDGDAAKEALRHNVSAQTSNEITDGKKNVYKEALEHVACTNYPVVPGLLPWTPHPGDTTGLLWCKELLPVGTYYKQSEDLAFSISVDYLNKLVNNFSAMQTNGVPVPLQLTHEGDGNQLGDVVSLYIAKRVKTPATKDLKLPVSLSLSTYNGAAAIMTLDELGAILGLTFTPEMDDAAKATMCKERLQSVLEAAKTATPPAASSTPPAAPAVAASDPPAPAGPSQVTVKFSKQPAVMVESLKRARTVELDQLVAIGAMTPAACDEAKKLFLTEDKIQLSLSREKLADDDYFNFVEVQKKNAGGAWSPSGRQAVDSTTGLSLSTKGINGQSVSPLIQDRLKRQEREKQMARPAFGSN